MGSWFLYCSNDGIRPDESHGKCWERKSAGRILAWYCGAAKVGSALDTDGQRMSGRYYSSIEAEISAISTTDDIAVAAFLFNGRRPTVIRVWLVEEEAGGGFLLIMEDDGLSVSRKPLQTVKELEILLSPEPNDHPTFGQAALVILNSFKAYAANEVEGRH